MAQFPDADRKASPPDHALPPVEPPSARFIVQLFVVPAVIVGLIVIVWLLFNWVASLGADPSKYVKAMARDNEARWQAAASLADLLNQPRNKAMKRDPRLATDLATLLTEELKRPPTERSSLKTYTENTDPRKLSAMLEVYLCRALGEMETSEALPPLLLAANPQTRAETSVRRAAIEGLSVLLSTLPPDQIADPAEVRQVLLAAATDQESQIRLAAAFALGAWGDAESTPQLRQMLEDTYPDVRYNAATALARQGDTAALPIVLEMLNPDEVDEVLQLLDRGEQSSLPSDLSEASRENFRNSKAATRGERRTLIEVNGLRAATMIAAAHLDLDITPLRTAVARLAESDQPNEVRSRAETALKELDDKKPAEATK
ncbi:MAG TPA: HEAT repeat domain-containing protein [Pirellulales bacterium]|jgi:HEAT repeat protein